MKKKIKKVKESSMVGNIKGFSSPFGSVVKRKGKKNNVSKPYGEAALFENLIIEGELTDQEIDEVVLKYGNQWKIYDDENPEIQLGSFQDRETAWEKQRIIRKQQQLKKERETKKKDAPKTAKQQEKEKEKTIQTFKKPAPKYQKKDKKQEVLTRLKEFLKEHLLKENVLTYTFEQAEPDKQTQLWNAFIEKLPKAVLDSDPKLRSIMGDLAKSKVKLLDKACKELNRVLGQSGDYELKDKKFKTDNQKGTIELYFSIILKDSGKTFPFSINIVNDRPMIQIPNQTKQELNAMDNPEGKSLRAELIHIQETIFENMEDAIQAAQKRDKYLRALEDEVDGAINNMNPLEIEMNKFLIKNKYKGIK